MLFVSVALCVPILQNKIHIFHIKDTQTITKLIEVNNEILI